MLALEHATLEDILSDDGNAGIRESLNQLLSPECSRYSFWIVDTERERTWSATKAFGKDMQRFWIGFDCYFEVRTDMDLEAKDLNKPPGTSAFRR